VKSVDWSHTVLHPPRQTHQLVSLFFLLSLEGNDDDVDFRDLSTLRGMTSIPDSRPRPSPDAHRRGDWHPDQLFMNEVLVDFSGVNDTTKFLRIVDAEPVVYLEIDSVPVGSEDFKRTVIC